MTPTDCFEIYADAGLYDQEFSDRVHEIPFFLERARNAGGSVLELACGTGRITLPIAGAGVDITGVDVVPAMIERAREKSVAAGLSVRWEIQDMRALDLQRRYALIFIATNALQHLHDDESLDAFFAGVRRHLARDGTLLLDVFVPSPAKLGRKPGSPYLKKSFPLADGRQIQVFAESAYHPESRLLHFTLTYRWGQDVVHRKDIRMRCFFPDELLEHCRRRGFRVRERLGNYDGSPFGAASPQQILSCSPES